MKTLERLRQMKSKTLDRMEALNALTKKRAGISPTQRHRSGR